MGYLKKEQRPPRPSLPADRFTNPLPREPASALKTRGGQFRDVVVCRMKGLAAWCFEVPLLEATSCPRALERAGWALHEVKAGPKSSGSS